MIVHMNFHNLVVMLFKFDVSLTVPAQELSADDVSRSKQVDLRDDHIRSSGSDSPASATAAEQHLPDNKESSNPQILDTYVNIGLVRDSSPSYAPSEPQQHNSHDMPGFSVSDFFQLYHPSQFVIEISFKVYEKLLMDHIYVFHESTVVWLALINEGLALIPNPR